MLPLRGEDAQLVRPYLRAHEERAGTYERVTAERRRALLLATYGVDVGPRTIHGRRLPGSRPFPGVAAFPATRPGARTRTGTGTRSSAGIRPRTGIRPGAGRRDVPLGSVAS
ncbi:hypothetical protein JNUCC64_17475 [Streptomyces sp. JNUCC 64]